MDISGSHRIPAPRGTVWAALNDPEVLKACIPGCERFERVGDGVFEGAVATKVGPMKTVMTGLVTLVAAQAPERATITAKGADPVAGGGEGVGEITLSEDGDGAVLAFEGSIQVDGKVGQLGQRLLTGVTKKQIEATCANLAARLEGAAPVPIEEAAELEPLPQTPPLVHEEPAEAPAVANAPPLVGEIPPLTEPTPIAPTAAPLVPEPEEIAASATGSGSTTRILLVAAIVAAVGAVAWYVLTQMPPPV